MDIYWVGFDGVEIRVGDIVVLTVTTKLNDNHTEEWVLPWCPSKEDQITNAHWVKSHRASSVWIEEWLS